MLSKNISQVFIQVLQEDPSIQSTWPDNALSLQTDNFTLCNFCNFFLFAIRCSFSFSECFLSVKWCTLKRNKNIMKNCKVMSSCFFIFFFRGGFIDHIPACMGYSIRFWYHRPTTVKINLIQLLEYPIPPPAARHKNRHMVISREPSVVS